MTDAKQILLGALVIIAGATAFYVIMPDNNVKMRIDNDKSTFYVYENRWLISGEEWNKLFNGSKLVRRHAKDVEVVEDYDIERNISTFIRTTTYYSGAVITDAYKFDGSNTDVEQFPVSHTIEIVNATGLIYQYEVRRLSYDGVTVKDVHSPQSFGRNMKVEFDDGYYYSKIYKYANKDEAKLLVKYRITEDCVRLNMRLFDPTPTITIISPINTTYVTSSVNLDWSSDVTANWSAYSLDGGTNTSFVTDGRYVNDDFSTASEGTGFSSGITQNETYFWIVNTVDKEVYKYHMNGTYTNDHFDIAVSGGSFFGITQNGTYFWIIDWGNDKVYKYYMNGTDTNDYFSTSASGNEFSTGITQNGTYFWITDYNAQKIYKYYMNGTYANDYFSTSGSENIYPMGIIQDGTYFWITHYYGNVYKYYMNGTYTNTYFSTTTDGASRTDGITKNETYFWIADNDDKKIYKYYLENFNNPINTTLTGVSEGSHSVIVWANDSSGSMNSTSVYFSVDSIYPTITINYPLNASTESGLFNVTFGETVDWSAYSLNGAANVSMGAVSTYQTTLTSGFVQGSNYITVHANDSADNMNSSTTYFTPVPNASALSYGSGMTEIEYKPKNMMDKYVAPEGQTSTNPSYYITSSIYPDGDLDVWLDEAMADESWLTVSNTSSYSDGFNLTAGALTLNYTVASSTNVSIWIWLSLDYPDLTELNANPGMNFNFTY